MCAYSVFNTFPVYPLSAKPLILLAFCRYRYHTSLFERPAFQNLFRELEQGTINCILVKDLSRFGRNYIEVGRYLERIFPVMRVRLIAVTDNYDSQSAWKTSDSIMVPMRNLLNDAYCRDISVKIKSQLAVKRKRGDFVGSFATYGYQKDPSNHTKLIVDELAAETVQNIFHWKIFPLLGVRFISVNDGYDSGMQIGNDVRGLEVAIKNIINASYSRDLSAKIAAADHVMQRKGMYLGGYRPFGFLPDPNDCHKLILDPVASQYVRLIFELALQGNRTGTIAKILNEKQIPTPAVYHVSENHVYSEQKAWDLQRSHWTSGMVYHILNNEKYKGTYVGAKFIMPVPCKHRVLRAPLEQQVRIEDSHAAIMTPEEFAQAQKVIMLQHGNHQAGNYTKRQYPLKGKVYCGYCRKLMKYRVLKKLGPSFNCRLSETR